MKKYFITFVALVVFLQSKAEERRLEYAQRIYELQQAEACQVLLMTKDMSDDERRSYFSQIEEKKDSLINDNGLSEDAGFLKRLAVLLGYHSTEDYFASLQSIRTNIEYYIKEANIQNYDEDEKIQFVKTDFEKIINNNTFSKLAPLDLGFIGPGDPCGCRLTFVGCVGQAYGVAVVGTLACNALLVGAPLCHIANGLAYLASLAICQGNLKGCNKSCQ